MSDVLRESFINSLPQPLTVRFFGEPGVYWPIIDIGVDVPLIRFDVCGKVQTRYFGEVAEVVDGDGVRYDSDEFYVEDASDE